MTSGSQDRSAARSRRRFQWLERLAVVVLIAAGAAAALLQDQRLWRLDAMIVDTFQRLAPRTYDPNLPVRIVDIDGESLKRFGQWPWPRTYFVELIRRLDALGAAAIAFDIVFAEPDRTSPEVLSLSAGRFDPKASQATLPKGYSQHDALFAQALATSAAPTILAAAPGGDPDPLLRKFGLVVAGGDPQPSMDRLAGLDGALPVLAESAQGYGLGGVDLGAGGVVRRAPVFQVAGGDIAPSIAMEALRLAQQAGGYVLRTSAASGEGGGGAEPVLVDARIGAVRMPLAPDGAAWMRFAGPQPARLLPAWKVLEGDPADPLLRAAVEGQIIFVAPTASGLGRPVQTPLGVMQPVEIQAELLEQAFTGVALQRPDWARPAEAVGLVLLGLATAFAVRRGSALVGAVVAALGPTAAVAAAWHAFDSAGLILAPLTPAATALAIYVVLTTLNYVRSIGETGAVRSQFERFVAPDVIRQLMEDPERLLAMRGESRDLTLLFCDARGFTTLSEQMTPDELIAYLNLCFSGLTDGVLSHGGTVDKYMGDCIMAFWNAPLDVPDHPEKAVAAMFAMREATDRLNSGFADGERPVVRFGFGLNAGPCNVGLMGSRQRLEYSCVGDTVNVASRLQDLTKAYGVWNLVTEAVASAAPGWIAAPVGETGVRGRSAGVRIFTILGPADMALSPAQQRLRQGLQDFAEAGGDAARREQALALVCSVSLPDIDGPLLAAKLAETAPAPMTADLSPAET